MFLLTAGLLTRKDFRGKARRITGISRKGIRYALSRGRGAISRGRLLKDWVLPRKFRGINSLQSLRLTLQQGNLCVK